MRSLLEANADVFECAGALQDYINETLFCGVDASARDYDVVPVVSVSLSHCGAIIEADEIQVWHSEQNPRELTPEYVIQLFRERCDYWARFSTAK